MRYALSIIACVFLSIFIYWYYEPNEVLGLKDVSSDLHKIFIQLDVNNDGALNPEEFFSLKNNYRILQKKPFAAKLNYKVQEFPELSVQLGEQILNIEVHFKPLTISSLSKNMTDLSHEELGILQSLLNWKIPHKERHPFGAKSFSAFLPKKYDAAPGFTWWIIEMRPQNLDPLENTRYYPPLVKKDNLILHALLSLFHPQAFLSTRFSPQGTAAVIRAVSDNFYDVIFRVHAEFQLNTPPALPFWFTPSQFLGRVIINIDGTVVKFFQMEVPDTKLNVDMEWFNGQGEENMEVDIGYIPEMSLISSAISVPSETEKGANENLSDIKWTAEITMEEAIGALEAHFFPFKKVKYYDLPQAFAVASNEAKLVHGIILWGNLADQSC